MDDPKSVVLASVEAYNRHDLAGCLGCLAPNATVWMAGVDRAIPLAQVELVYSQLFASGTRVTIRSMVASGNVGAAEYDESFIDERTQARVTRPVVIFYEVERGKIQVLRQYSHPTWFRPAPA